ncbi:MAG: hypothetical protein RLZZ182_2025 [Pseudomonadota bacterium]|jgi:hypothetical protein
MSTNTPAELAPVIEEIAAQWDGCTYDAPGETIDIGDAIRRAGKRLMAAVPSDAPADAVLASLSAAPAQAAHDADEPLPVAQALRAVLSLIRRNAPELSGKVIGDAERALAAEQPTAVQMESEPRNLHEAKDALRAARDEADALRAALDASIAAQAAGTPAGQAADSDAQPATHVDQLAAALGWPGGISDPITSWQTLLRAAAELARAATPQPSQPAATIGRAATPEMIAAGAKAAREYYMATQGGNSPSVIWEAMYDAATASLPSPPAAPVEQDGSVHVECRRCTECCHTGINDARDDHAVCSSCDWSGREPGHDECPACGEVGTMSAACPDCGGRYRLIAEGDVSARAPSAAPQGGQEAGPVLAEALAEKMADAECEPNEAAWRYMGATERASWIAAGGWISVNDERLPDDGGSYIIANQPLQMVAPLVGGVILNNVGTKWDWGFGVSITHWRPLPAAPSAQGEAS